MNDFEAFKQKTARANVVPVVTTMSADLLTPLAVYLKISAGSESSFLLESVEGGETLARFSFIGADPDFLAIGNSRSVRITDGNTSREDPVPMIRLLREHFKRYHVLQDETLPSFVGGAIGIINFDCVSWFEPSLKTLGVSGDEATLMFFRSLVAFDHAKQEIQIISLVFTDDAEGKESELRALFDAAVANNCRLRHCLENGETIFPSTSSDAVSGPATSNIKRDLFEKKVLEIKELINAGEAYQVVLSQCFSKPTFASPLAIYRAIRTLNPSPYMFLISFAGKSVIGASPEMLIRARGQNLEYRPIAGTRPRGLTAVEDQRLACEMKDDLKEVAEHSMLVDLGRNDLGRVAEYGSVKVDHLMQVEKYSHVQHLVSHLSARLREGLDRFDALASCFPAGTVSGAPKVRAVKIIRDLEPDDRGIYAGAIGYFDYSGNMDTCIAIRTLTLENGLAKVQAGAGIVADSIPSLEYNETVNKAKAMLKAIEIAEAAQTNGAYRA